MSFLKLNKENFILANYYNKDLYKILNVNFDASVDEIKVQYRKLVHLYHPDVSKNESDIAKFKEIQEAYEILTNVDKRKKYDVIHGYYKEKIKKQFEASYRNEKLKEKLNKQKNPGESSFTKSINDAIDNLFTLKKKKDDNFDNKKPINGDDISIDLSVSLIESITGTNRKINIVHTRPCPNCGGRKFINGQNCLMCKGEGEITYNKKINVKIPQGVVTGSKVRIKKEGNLGQNGGHDGDLYLIITVENNNYYSIDKLDIHCNLPITPFEAVFGTQVNIALPDGAQAIVKIPEMTSSGQKLKLVSQGLFSKDKTKRGDVIINVMIKLPKKLSDKEKELYKQLSEISSENIRADFDNAK